jgi:putative ABC transport system permease protein
MSTAAVIVRDQTGVALDVFRFQWVLVITPIVMILLGALAGVIPAVKAYSTDVATNLAPMS